MFTASRKKNAGFEPPTRTDALLGLPLVWKGMKTRCTHGRGQDSALCDITKATEKLRRADLTRWTRDGKF